MPWAYNAQNLTRRRGRREACGQVPRERQQLFVRQDVIDQANPQRRLRVDQRPRERHLPRSPHANRTREKGRQAPRRDGIQARVRISEESAFGRDDE